MRKMSKFILCVVVLMSGCSTGFHFGIDVPVAKTHHKMEIEVSPHYITGYTENGVGILLPERIVYLEGDRGQILQ